MFIFIFIFMLMFRYMQISYDIKIVYLMFSYNDIFIDGDPIVNFDECTLNMTVVHWFCFNL